MESCYSKQAGCSPLHPPRRGQDGPTILAELMDRYPLVRIADRSA